MRSVIWMLLAAFLAGAAGGQEFPDPVGVHPVLVTVDDLPISSRKLHPDPAERARITGEMLAVLKKHGIRAVGFVPWRNVGGPADEALLESWLAGGHALGNHSFGHPDYSRTDVPAYLADLERGRAALQAFLAARGGTLRYFRFPFLREGDTPEKLREARAWLARTGQRSVPVTIDNQDWSFEEPWVTARQAADPARLVRLTENFQQALRLEVLSQTALGDELLGRPTPQVLLLHATEVGAAQWDALFTWMKGRGFSFAGPEEVLADPAFESPPEFVGRYGGTLWGRIAHQRRSEKARSDIAALLERQAADWSRGDLESFCSVYAEDAAFLTPAGLTRGRQALLERYRQRYPDVAAMGVLQLEVVELREIWGPEVTMLGDAEPGRIHGVTAVARWRLERPGQPEAAGLTLLVFRRDGSRWQIVQDASM